MLRPHRGCLRQAPLPSTSPRAARHGVSGLESAVNKRYAAARPLAAAYCSSMSDRTVSRWLMSSLVCPVDFDALSWAGGSARCLQSGHEFPVVHGIPVMLRSDVRQTHNSATTSLTWTGAIDRFEPAPTVGTAEAIEPFVQEAVAATSGNLYRPLLHRLVNYPIPDMRLPTAGSAGSRLLDIGCNWGRWCVAAGRRRYTPVGIDVNLQAVLAARSVLQRCSIEGDLVVADARYLPFRAETFQAIFSYSVLQHFSRPDTRLAVREAGRVLERGHPALIQMPNRYGIRSAYHQAKRGFRDARDFEVRYWRPSELAAIFTQLIGPTKLEVDGFFGLGIQPTDAHMFLRRHRAVVKVSELLRKASNTASVLTWLADSLYVRSVRDQPSSPVEGAQTPGSQAKGP